MINKKTKAKIVFLIMTLVCILTCNFVSAETVSTSYKNINETAYIYVGDISLTDITYSELSKVYMSVKGIISNKGNNDASYDIKVVYYTASGEIIGSSTESGFIENGESLGFNIVSSVYDYDNDYSIKDVAKYKVSLSPREQGDAIGSTTVNKETDKKFKDFDFVIDNYKIDMVVNENNTYDITEVLDVTFNKSKHGIYRDIPLRNKIVRNDGTTYINKAQIKDIDVSEKYTTSRTASNIQIKIGDANRYVNGYKQYVIKYTYNIGKDPLEGLDEMYFNLIGTEWETAIRKVEFNISMPKNFDASKVGFSSGNYGSLDNKYVDYSVEGNSIKGTYNNILMPGEALTVRVELPEGYYVGAKHDVSIFAIIAAGVSLSFLLIAFVMWNKHGKDDQVVETVEFYPPNNAGPLDVGFMYKGYTETNDVVSLLIHLANKGYISIEETEDSSLFTISSFVITKLKDYDENNEAEKMFMEGLFKKRSKKIKDTVIASDLRYTFYRTINKIKNMMNTKTNKNKVFETVSSGLGKWLILMTIAIYSIITIPPVLMYSEIGPMAILFAMVFPIIGEAIFITMVFGAGEKVIYVNGVPTTSKIVSIIFGSMFGVFFGGMPWLIIVLPCILVETSWKIVYVIGIASIIAILIFLKLMPKRTKLGTEMLGRIRGFKRFLETAEKDELEAMVTKNPKYFYDILPYAYVLGVSDKWIKQFETIALMPPNWYIGHGPFSMHRFGGFIDSTMQSATTAMTSAPTSSYGGGSSGGFSGGGGGSSGGGSGGGGGGSW